MPETYFRRRYRCVAVKDGKPTEFWGPWVRFDTPLPVNITASSANEDLQVCVVEVRPSDDMTNNEAINALAVHIIESLRPLTDAQRLEVMNAISGAFCQYCGTAQPTTGQRCQCWNDE